MTKKPEFQLDTTQVSIDSIRGRESDTRATAVKHVCKLAASIREVGLIHPIVIDAQGTLLAGGHRLAAIQKLRTENEEAFEQWFSEGKVPVRVLDVDATDPTKRRALEIEISENEKRRDYTTTDLAHLVERLKEAGYSTRLGGPASGRRHVTGALATIIGKSERTVRRLLQKPGAEREDTFEKSVRSLKRALERTLTAIEEVGCSDEEVDKLRRVALRAMPVVAACLPDADDEDEARVA